MLLQGTGYGIEYDDSSTQNFPKVWFVFKERTFMSVEGALWLKNTCHLIRFFINHNSDFDIPQDEVERLIDKIKVYKPHLLQNDPIEALPFIYMDYE